MTKVEVDGKTYCVETLIYERERLIRDVKTSAENHRLVLDMIRDEINEQCDNIRPYNIKCAEGLEMALRLIDEYR